ncbi:MAG: class I adenylate cyclase [Desulfovibrionaceae bacterium]
MPDELKRLTEILGTFRGDSQSFYETGGLKAMSDLADEALALIASVRRATGRTPVQASLIAYALQQPAEADMSGNLLRASLDFWLKLGPPGWVLAIEYLRRNIIPFNLLEPVLAALPQDLLLILLHQYARQTRPMDQAFVQWCDAALTTPRTWDVDAAMRFLAVLHRWGHTATIQARETLARAKIPAALAVRAASGTTEASVAIRALTALGDTAATPLLVDALSTATAKTLPPLLDALALLPPQPGAPRSLGPLLKHADPGIRLRVLHALIAQQSPRLDAVFEFLIKHCPTERTAIYPRILLLDPVSHARLYNRFPAKSRNVLGAVLFALIAQALPDVTAAGLRATLKSGRIRAEADDPAVEAAKAFYQRYRAERHFLKAPPASPVAPREQRQAKKKGGLFGGKKADKGNEVFRKALEVPFTVEELDVSGYDVSGFDVGKVTFKAPLFRDARLKQMSFKNAEFSKASFDGCGLMDIVFDTCRFDKTSFAGAALENVAFINCTFKKTDFSGAFFDTSPFSECQAARCRFAQTGWRSSRLEACLFRDAPFSDAVFEDCGLSGVRLECVDLTGSQWRHCALGGAECVDCAVDEASFEGINMRETTFDGSSCHGARFLDMAPDHPVLMQAVLDYQDAALRAAAANGLPQPPAWTRTPAGAAMAQAVVNYWIANRDLARREQTMLANNHRRTSMALATLGQQKSEFYRMLPHLLQCNAFERTHATDKNYPLCRVHGYEPGYSLLDSGRSHLPGFSLAPPPTSGPRVEAIYTIGSVGSIAMTDASDLDYWVCVHPDDATPDVLAQLQDKLVRISQWADTVFDLETTFFVMNMEAVRRNDFGFSDKESSGSAQALLLKEEFYRTALKVCGGNLAWWLAPPGADDAEYARRLDLAANAPGGLGERTTNMGNMASIPPGEFFGASLWQLVKAFKSPFKSIMKFGLLEKYVAGKEGDTMLLCDRIKVNLMAGRPSLFGIDPYAVLFKEVRDYYATGGMQQAAQLMNLAFLFKLGDRASSLDRTDEHTLRKRKLLGEFFGSDNGATQEQIDRVLKRQGFAEMLKLGDQVNAFMVTTYGRVQQSLKDRKIEVKINPTDLTKMGRKLFAAFSRRTHKVERIPFVNPVKGGFQELQFMAEKAPGKKAVWIVKGLPPRVPSRRENYVEVRRDTNLPYLLGWIMANKIFNPKALIDVDKTMAPVSAQDVTQLLPALYDFFPAKLFDVDLDETLKEERVTRAFLALNLLSDRGQNSVRDVAILFTNNWGELFCMHVPVKDDIIRRDPRKFLAQHVKLDVADCELAHSVPHRSKCPRLPM